jgi:LAO/AO transport system kinase
LAIEHAIKRRTQPTAQELVTGILKGDKTALSRAITLVESTNPQHLEKQTAL